jgi:hypothetical protein
MGCDVEIWADSEAGMVMLFVELLRSGTSPWGGVGVLQEFCYLRGRTDVVVTTIDSIIAFEAKLKDWRRALDQAYRNTCFAEQSFVLLPSNRAKAAMRHIGEFEERGIGLCCIEESGLQILHTPNPRTPLEPWLSQRVRGLVT